MRVIIWFILNVNWIYSFIANISRNVEKILDQLEKDQFYKESTPSNITNHLSSPISLNNIEKIVLDENKIFNIPRYIPSSTIEKNYMNESNISSNTKNAADMNKLPSNKKINIIIENTSENLTSKRDDNTIRKDFNENSPVPVYKRA